MEDKENTRKTDRERTASAEPEENRAAEAAETVETAGAAEAAETAVPVKKKRSEAMSWIRDILIAVVIAIIIAQCIQPTIVREHSMQDTLQPNDYLILNKLAYKFGGEIEYGDIVVFHSSMQTEDGDEKLLIKRVIAKGGDTISIEDGQVYRNGELLAEQDDDLDVDYVAGVPDSGTAHALGYANRSRVPYARPLIKYTPTWPRSFMPQNQKARNLIAKMKLVPVFPIIKDKKFVLIDDSIVRGTQLSETISYLIENGAKEIHVRSACPPIMYGCKYLNFSRSVSDLELITRRVIKKLEGIEGDEIPADILAQYAASDTEKHEAMVEEIRQILKFDSLKFQKLEDTVEAIGVDRCNLCTYCWDGKE